MAKFVAKQALDMTQLPGISYLFDPENSYFYDRGSSNFRVAENANREGYVVLVEGRDFGYAFSQPTGKGKVTALDVNLDKKPLYKITGLDVNLDKLFDKDLDKALSALFRGKDTFKGSDGIDILASGTGRDSLKGEDGNDTLHGDGGRDRLDGGHGVDTLDGGKGKDTYVFSHAPSAAEYSRIEKFQKGETIELSAKFFPPLEKGALSDDNFLLIGSRAADGDDYIQYDAANARILYDADGSGPIGGIVFAYLQADAKFGADNVLIA